MDSFYMSNGKYYVVINSKSIEVTENFYKEYKKIKYNTDYQNKKYYKWNKSHGNIISEKYEYIFIKKQKSIEEIYVEKEEYEEKLQKISNRNKLILKGLLNGYTETEIAYELGIHQSTVNWNKKKILKEYNKDNK